MRAYNKDSMKGAALIHTLVFFLFFIRYTYFVSVQLLTTSAWHHLQDNCCCTVLTVLTKNELEPLLYIQISCMYHVASIMLVSLLLRIVHHPQEYLASGGLCGGPCALMDGEMTGRQTVNS